MAFRVSWPQSPDLELMLEWSQDRFVRSFLAAECDYLRGNGRQDSAHSLDEELPESGAPTSAKCLTKIDRSIRDGMVNSVAYSVTFLVKDDNVCLIQCALAPAKFLKAWEDKGNAQLRSSLEGAPWAVDQATGGFMDHLNSMVKALSNQCVRARCRFILDSSVKASCDDETKSHLYVVEWEFAIYLGRCGLVLTGIRLRMGLWYMVGWPWSMSAVLKDQVWKDRTLRRFLRDPKNYTRLRDKEDLILGELEVKAATNSCRLLCSSTSWP